MSTDPTPVYPTGHRFLTDDDEHPVLDDYGTDYELCTCGEWLRPDEMCNAAYHDDLFNP